MFSAHKSVFFKFVSYMDGKPNVVSGDDSSSLDGILDTPLTL